MKIDLTYNFFLHEWGTPTGRLWLWLQPCLARKDLERYLEHMSHPQDLGFHLYRLGGIDCESGEDLVPVPFPAGVDLEVITGPGEPAVASVSRRARLRVLKPGLLEKQNAATRKASGEDAVIEDSPKECDTGAFLPHEKETFAAAYQRMLREAIDPGSKCSVSFDELADFLRLALWMGSRWVVSPESVEGVETDAALMALPHTSGDPKARTTNLHSLLGHLVCLGGVAEAAGLAAKPGLAIRFSDATGWNRELPLAPGPGDPARLAAYFSSVGSVVADPGRVVRAFWNCRPEDPGKALDFDLETRVYVRPRSITLSRSELRGAFNAKPAFSLVRRDREPGETKDEDAGRLRTLRVVPLKDVFTKRPNLQLRLVDTYRVQVLPYRSAPALGWAPSTNIGDEAWCLAAVVPRREEAMAFAAEAASGGGIPASFRLLDAAFQSLPFEPVGWVSLLAPDGPGLLLAVPAKCLRPEPPSNGRTGSPGKDKGTYLAVFDRGTVLSADWQAPSARSGGHWLWEGAAFGGGGKPEGKFDTIVVENPAALHPEGDEGVAAAASFEGDCDYQFARSISRMEGVLGVAFDVTGAGGAQGDCDEDARNFSALNVFATDSPAPGAAPEIDRLHLNADSELYPVLSRCEPASYFQWYHFVYRMPGRFASVKASKVREELRALYLRRRVRTLRFTVEHALGVEHVLSDDPTLSCRLDFPVVLPMDAGDDQEGETRRGRDDARSFLVVDYEEGAADRLGAVSLRLRLEWLSAPVAEKRNETGAGGKDSDPRAWARFTTAWSAIAELAAAGEVRLELHQYGFDKAGARADQPGSGWPCLATDRIGDAAVSQLVASCRDWLEGKPLPADGLWSASVPLSGVSRAGDLGVIRLTVQRPLELIPGHPSSFALVRPRKRSAAPSADGSRDERPFDVELVPSAHADSAGLKQWIEGLSTGDGVVPAMGKTYEDGRMLLQASGAHLEGADAGAVFLLGALRNAIPDARAQVAVCPLAFKPVATDEYLGPATLHLLRRYFEAVDDYLAFGLEGELACPPKTWASKIRQIEGRTADLRELLGEACRGLLPAYEARGNEVSGMADVLRELAGSVAPSKLRESVLKWLARELEASPAVYGSSKALQYTRVHFPGGGGVPRDLVGVRTWRQLRPGQPEVPRETTVGLEGIPSVDPGPGWFGFFDVLPDAEYGNEFHYTASADPPAVRLEPLSVRLAGLKTLPSTAKPYGLVDDRVELPDGWMYAGPKASFDPCPIRLPSREPMVDPVAAWAGNLDTGGEEVSSAVRRLESAISRAELLSGRLVGATTEGDRLRVVARTKDAVGLPTLDGGIASAVFVIRSDEEGTVENDSFRIGSEDSTAKAGAKVADPDVLKLFFELLSWRRGGALANQDGLLAPNVVSYVREMLSRGSDRDELAKPTSDASGAVTLVQQGTELVFDAQPAAPLGAFLLESVSADAKGNADMEGARSLVLLVSRKCPIWRRQRVSLQQSRNERSRTDAERPFAAAFSSRSNIVGAEELSYPGIPRGWTGPAAHLGRSCQVSELVSAWGSLDPLWRTARLSVTVFEVGRIDLPSERVDDAIGEEEALTVHEDRFPIVVRKFESRAPGDPNDPRDLAEEWFPEPYRRFSVDLQWFSESNQQILRLSEMPVEIGD